MPPLATPLVRKPACGAMRPLSRSRMFFILLEFYDSAELGVRLTVRVQTTSRAVLAFPVLFATDPENKIVNTPSSGIYSLPIICAKTQVLVSISD